MIADDSFLIREGLRQLLTFLPQVEVIGCYDGPASLLQAVQMQQPEVVLVDIRMPPTYTDEGLQVAEQLQRTFPEIAVVVLSQHGVVPYALRLLSGGAARRAYILKDRIHDLALLLSTIEGVAAGECRIDPKLVDAMVAAQRGGASASTQALTPRQRQILGAIASGKSNLAIAREFNLSQGAVEKHVNEIFTRLGVANDDSVSRRVAATLIHLADHGGL